MQVPPVADTVPQVNLYTNLLRLSSNILHTI